MVNRRTVLKSLGSSLLFTPVGCAGVATIEPTDVRSDRVVLGSFPAQELTAAEDAVHQTLEHMDMSWLRTGDSVFVKVASNSINVHPAVTSPAAVRAMCRALLARGASRVVVGDQCGVMSARLSQVDGEDRRWRTTQSVMEANGLTQAIIDGGGEPHYFDDHGYDDGYVVATMRPNSSWRYPPRIARIATEVDHIVYLPRLSSHLMTGYSHGHKLAVGWLRDDSRHHMHHEAGDIFEKYTDVNYCDEIASRLRLVLTLAEEVLCTGGPDSGGIAIADPRLVLASSHLANHDAVAVAVLTWAQQQLAHTRDTVGVPYGPWASGTNAAFLAAVESQTGMPWTSTDAGLMGGGYWPHDYSSVATDRSLQRAYQLLGGVPRSIEVAWAGSSPDTTLQAHLRQRSPQLDLVGV
jgi:uncharacterized protein (DUF362 family)